ncbi:targeting protein for Xklp2-like isoform 2-T2 [Pholidichthys leucotaenia]
MLRRLSADMAKGYSNNPSEDYEFDAPTHVVDFGELVEAENDDRWFDQQADGGSCRLVTPLRPAQLSTTDDHHGPSADPGSRRSCSPPSNIVTSWGNNSSAVGGARPKQRRVLKVPAQPCRVSKRRKGARGPAAPPVKVKKQMSSEEQELKRMRALQREVALHRKKNEASYKTALAGGTLPKKMVLSATVPQEFNFSTETRVKASKAEKEADLVSQLRKPTSPAKARRGATVPKPSHLSEGKQREMTEPGAYVPMAQQIEQFQKRTPARYHLRSRIREQKGPSPVKNHLKLTQPHSPFLMTRQRNRPLTVKSTAELEAEEAEQLQKFKIKPVELNKNILESAEDLKKPPVKAPTVPEGFQLEIERRLQERQATKKPLEDDEKGHNFRANPPPSRILEGVVGLPPKKVAPPTIPESPAFALKQRVRLERKVEAVKKPSPVKAPPVPHFGLPFQPRCPENHQVEVCPFSFDHRDKERWALKEKKLEEMRKEEVPQFKAQPLPDFDTVLLPEKKRLEPTKPEPFKLLLDDRGAVKNSRWEQMVKEEQKRQEKAAMFKARPNEVTCKEPFRPKLEARAAVAVKPFELATEQRAREWQEMQQLVSEKEALKAHMEAERRREEGQREKEEIARLRQEQVHQAQPIRHYKPVMVKKSEVPLTVPHSPEFSDRFRI